MNTAELCRAEPFIFALTDGRRFQVAPPTRGAFRSALALDPAEANPSPSAASSRRARQLAALLGNHLVPADCGEPIPSAAILGNLCPPEEMKLLGTIAAQGMRDEGERPPASSAGKRSLAERLHLFDRDTFALALHLQRTATEVENAVGFIESLLLLESVYGREKERLRWDAAIHGIRL